MRTVIALIPVVLGVIPLLLNTGYIWNAWQASRLDSCDWIFLPAFLLSVAFAARQAFAGKHKWDPFALVPLIVFLGCIVVFHIQSIHALTIISSIVFWWSLSWLFFGWNSAYTLLPPFAILLLMTTSSTYWISFFFGLPPSGGFLFKVCAGLLFLCWEFVNIRFHLCLRRGTLCFCLGLLVAFGMILQVKSLTRSCPPLRPEFPLEFADYLGRSLPLNDNFRRFFRESDATQYRYANAQDVLAALAMKCGRNIHEIHPATHCLRTSGWQIDSERLVEYELKERTFQVTEIQAHTKSSAILVWVWFSSDKVSTGSFLGFRRVWRPNTQWYTYQFSTALTENIDDARQTLFRFLNTIPWHR